MRVASDVGGTFTDLVYYDEGTGSFGSVKASTTPPDYERGVLDTVHKSGLDTSAIVYFAPAEQAIRFYGAQTDTRTERA
jgi:N-methylhydantoinase A